MNVLGKPIEFIQSQLAFIEYAPIDWKTTAISLSWAITGFESYLITRQLPYFARNAPPESLTQHFKEGVFEKSQIYGLDKARFALVSGVYSQIVDTLFIYFDGYPWLWSLAGRMLAAGGLQGDHEVLQSIFFVTLTSIVGSLPGIPVDVYRTFVLEEKHGFNKTTPAIFITDMLKNWVLLFGLVSPFIYGFVKIIAWKGDGFIPYMMGFLLAFQMILVVLFPLVIQPLFNKLSPLDPGPLRTKIDNLATQLKFPLTDLYVIDGSKRSSHSNAYFYGLPWSKHIVLFDTLIKKTPGEEIEAVLAHELGHWAFSHPTKLMAISQIHLLMLFSTFPPFLHSIPLLQSFGFSPSVYISSAGKTHIPVVLAFFLFQLAISPFDTLVKFAMNGVTRRFEYQADKFAADLKNVDANKSITVAGGDELNEKGGTMGERLGRALIGLHVENLSTVWVDWLYSAYHHSHPTLTERLKALEGYEKAGKEEKKTR